MFSFKYTSVVVQAGPKN